MGKKRLTLEDGITEAEQRMDEMLFDAFSSGLPHEKYGEWIRNRNAFVENERRLIAGRISAGSTPKDLIVRPAVEKILQRRPDAQANELWDELFLTLEQDHNLDVEEKRPNARQPKTWMLEYYNEKGERKLLKYRTFQNILSKLRKK